MLLLIDTNNCNYGVKRLKIEIFSLFQQSGYNGNNSFLTADPNNILKLIELKVDI